MYNKKLMSKLYYLNSRSQILNESVEDITIDNAFNVLNYSVSFVYTEGVNLDAMKKYSKMRKEIKALKKVAKECANNKDYDESIKILKKINIIVANNKQEIMNLKSSSMVSGLVSDVVGYIIVDFMILIQTILILLPSLLLGGLPSVIFVTYQQILTIYSMVIRFIRDKDNMSPLFNIDNWNMYVDRMLVAHDLIIDKNNKIIKEYMSNKNTYKRTSNILKDIDNDMDESTADDLEEESVVGTIGPMIPQIGLNDKTNESIFDSVEFEHVILNRMDGIDTYTESSLIENIKSKFKKGKEKLTNSRNVENALNLYLKKELNKMSYTASSFKFKHSKNNAEQKKMNKLKKDQVKFEKLLRQCEQKMTPQENKEYKKLRGELDTDLKKQQKSINASIKEIGKKSLMTESTSNIDSDIKDVIDELNKKGYSTKYSSAGHENLRKKEDRNNDGKYNGKLYTDARIMFKDDYNFPDPPKYWVMRNIDGFSYLDVPPITYNENDGDENQAFDKWKASYMESLRKWVNELPWKKTSEENPLNPASKNITESVEIDDNILDQYYNDLMLESTFSDNNFIYEEFMQKKTNVDVNMNNSKFGDNKRNMTESVEINRNKNKLIEKVSDTLKKAERTIKSRKVESAVKFYVKKELAKMEYEIQTTNYKLTLNPQDKIIMNKYKGNISKYDDRLFNCTCDMSRDEINEYKTAIKDIEPAIKDQWRSIRHYCTYITIKHRKTYKDNKK